MWPGSCQIKYYHSPKPLNLTTKDGGSISLPDVAKANTPPCNLNPFLFNGHMQTCFTAVKSTAPAVVYKRRIFEAEDPTFPGSFAVDFVDRTPPKNPSADPKVNPKDPDDSTTPTSLPPRTTHLSDEELKAQDKGIDDSRPMLVALHGLSGGSHEVYLRCGIEPLLEQGSEWEICVINGRGCAGSKITGETLFNARATWDLRHLVKWLRKTYPNRPLFGIGFSLGANILTNYLGEEGDSCQLKAAVLCCNPWNLEIGDTWLQNTWMGRTFYITSMGQGLMKVFEANVEQLAKNPNIDVERVRKEAKTLYEFDRVVTVPCFGYPTYRCYYRDASSADAVVGVKIPTLAISAVDDPVAVNHAIPYEEIEKNPNMCLITTSGGGHLAYFQLDGNRWFPKPACGFLQKMAADIDLDAPLEGKEVPLPTGPCAGKYVPVRHRLTYDSIA